MPGQLGSKQLLPAWPIKEMQEEHRVTTTLQSYEDVALTMGVKLLLQQLALLLVCKA